MNRQLLEYYSDDYILTDHWFGAKANMNFIQNELRKKFIFGMKSNRGVALTQTQQSCGQFQSVKSLKQNVSLAKSPTKVMRSPLDHIFASFIGFCKNFIS